MRQPTGALDHGTEFFSAERFQCEPRLQCPEPSRQIRSEIARPRRARRESSRLAPQIGRRRCKGIEMTLTVANQKKAGVVRHLSPFVEIERNGIRILQSGEPRRQRWRKNPERAIGTIDVKPEFLFTA